MIRQAYGVVVTVNEQNEIHAFKLPGSDKPLFEQIRTDKKTRIVKEGLNPEALLPEGPYDLWQEGDESRLATELKEAFARYPRLPKVLRPGQVTDAVSQGVREGLFVARLPRPDKSFRTWWREDMEPEVVKDDLLEIVLPNRANLAAIDHLLLTPGQLPGLWEADDSDEFRPLPVASVLKYFAGGHVATIPRDGYDDQIPIPACPEGVVLNAVEAGVRDGTLWITNHSASCWKEDLPAGIVIENVKLRPPPDPVLPRDLVKEAVPSAWSNDSTNGLKLTKALRQKRPVALPWGAVRDGINEAIASRWLALTSKSGSVECSYDLSHRVVLTEPEPGGTEPPPRPVTLSMTEIQALAEAAPDLLIAIGSAALAFTVSVSADGAVTRQDRAKVDAILATVSPALKLRD